jgi:protein-S-isoprenylcysteine O-methyltransferase Ste14
VERPGVRAEQFLALVRLTIEMPVTQPLLNSGGTAGVLFWGLCSIWIGGELLLRVRSLFQRGATRDRGSFFVLVASIALGFAIAAAATRSAPGAGIQSGRDAVFAVGLAILAVGVALRFYAVIVLGRFFTLVVMTRRDQHVVDTGPYRWIRHPSYTGFLLALAAVMLSYANWLALIGVLPALAGFLYRIRVEERVLSDELGEPYRSYMRRTKRLVPFVY